MIHWSTYDLFFLNMICRLSCCKTIFLLCMLWGKRCCLCVIWADTSLQIPYLTHLQIPAGTGCQLWSCWKIWRTCYKLLGERHWEFLGNISNVRIVNRTFYNTLLSSAVPGIAWYWKCLNQSDHVQSCPSRSSLANHKRKTTALLPSPVHRSQMCCQYEWRCMRAHASFPVSLSPVLSMICARGVAMSNCCCASRLG